MSAGPARLLCLAAIVVAVSAAAVAALAGPATQWQGWPLRTGFTVLRYAAIAGLVGAGLGLLAALAAVATRRYKMVLVGLLAVAIGGAAFAIPWSTQQRQAGMPVINDITTDTEDPPAFIANLPLRQAAKATNAPGYPGAAFAEKQRTAYPDIGPVVLTIPPDQAFERARSAAAGLGWTVTGADPTSGRIEATTRTRWFGFVDDVVIRVRPENGGSRIDVRSKSRLGRADFGTNARRVRTFIAALK